MLKLTTKSKIVNVQFDMKHIELQKDEENFHTRILATPLAADYS
jgi:hypothetical protein